MSKEYPTKPAELSDDELREMLDARELEKELERKRTSRLFTKILLVFAVVLIGAVLCFPNNRKVLAKIATPEDPAAIATRAALLNGKNPDGSEIPAELKPFSIKPGDSNHRADMRFATELLQFIQPQPREPENVVKPAPPAASHKER